MDQPLLGIMDIVVERNAFGRQVDSFEADLRIEGWPAEAKPFPAVFIRAPKLIETKETAQPIATLADGSLVAAQQGKWMVTSFHPELTLDDRFHRYFLDIVGR